MMNQMHGMHHKCKHYGLLALRLAAGLILVVHGYGKLFGNAPGMSAFTGMVGSLGFPMPTFFAYVAALTEFVGGILLLIGFWTQIASVLIAIVMLVAFIGAKHYSLPAGDPDLALFAIMVAIYTMGPGRFSVKAMLKRGECCGKCEGGKCVEGGAKGMKCEGCGQEGEKCECGDGKKK